MSNKILKTCDTSELINENMLTETNTPFFFIENPILYQRYLDSFPPKEAYYYFPKGEEIIIPNKKNPEKSLRRIFFNTEFNEHEKKWLIEFNKIIEQHPENKLPDFWNDSYNLKYIYSENCKLQKAYERMINNINHQKNFFPLTFTPKDKALTIINMGFCYIFGRDHQFRPILIINTGILIKRIDEFSTDDMIRSGMFIIEFIKNKMFIKGQIENLLMIINFEDTNIISLPDKLKKTLMELNKNFVSILYKTYFIGVNFIIRLILKIIFAFLDKVTVKKVVVLDNKNDKRILENISPNNLEKRFGGEAENINYEKGNLFPPFMPKNKEFLLKNEDKKNILITEEKYIQMVKKDLIIKESISPFILKKIEEEKEKNELKNEINLIEENVNDDLNINNISCSYEFFDDKSNNDKSNNNFFNYKNKTIKLKYNNFVNEINDFNNNKKLINWNIFNNVQNNC